MTTESVRASLFEKLERIWVRASSGNALAYALVLLAPVLVVVTVTALQPLNTSRSDLVLRVVLLLDLVYILAVASLVGMRISAILAARRANSAGSKLHLRLTTLFALLALIPTVLVAIFAVVSINLGLEGWFSKRVGDVLSNSLNAALAYEEEHRESVLRDGKAVAEYLADERAKTFFMNTGELRRSLDNSAVTSRELTEVFVIDSAGDIQARGPDSYLFDFERPSSTQISQALEDTIALIEDWPNNEFRALLPIDGFKDRLLYVTRQVDGEILALLDETRATVGLYQQLESDRGRLLFEFGLLYLGFALILILAAIWLGLRLAERLAQPIGDLVTASREVGTGNLDVRVKESDYDDEITLLGHNFNLMTRRLKTQRETLLQNTQQIERRRRLFDSVLGSVTSGVIGLDPHGSIAFVNKSASRLLNIEEDPSGQHLDDIVPEFGHLFQSIKGASKESVQEQVTLNRAGMADEILLLRLSTRRNRQGDLEGYVIAFDDVTNLVSAQRMAAWGDVARRIAHEIKNPLTPIQLSAERIKRKFSPMVGEQSDDLADMADVIVRQTNDLRYIVDEFSRFARMPAPRKDVADLRNVLRDVIGLQTTGQPDVHFESTLTDDNCETNIDVAMMSQALTNLVKNAGEAIDTYKEKHPENSIRPEIHISIETTDDEVVVTIADNGIGLPKDRSRLFEPYVTTREKGTGLGLPIVKKIVEEHNGVLVLTDAPTFDGNSHYGAMAIMRLPKSSQHNQKLSTEAAE